MNGIGSLEHQYEAFKRIKSAERNLLESRGILMDGVPFTKYPEKLEEELGKVSNGDRLDIHYGKIATYEHVIPLHLTGLELSDMSVSADYGKIATYEHVMPLHLTGLELSDMSVSVIYGTATVITLE